MDIIKDLTKTSFCAVAEKNVQLECVCVCECVFVCVCVCVKIMKEKVK